MAKKASTQPTLRDIVADIHKGEMNPVYILMGEEDYYLDLLVANFEKYAVPETERDFDYSLFYGNDVDIDYLIGAAKQFPFMSERRLVILKEAQSLPNAKKQLEKLAPYLENPAPATVFVLVYKGEPFAATSQLMKAVKSSGGVVFRSDPPRDYQLLGHARDYCQQKKTSIDDNALQLLCEWVGLPLSKLFGEIDKLASIGSGRRITEEDVRKNIGNSREFGSFDFVDALSHKNYPKALQIVKYMEDTGAMDMIIFCTAQAFTYFGNLVAAHYMSDKTDASLSEAFGFKAQVQLRSLKEGMRNYTPMQAVNAVHYLREFDTKNKGIDSMGNRYALLREMIFKLFT